MRKIVDINAPKSLRREIEEFHKTRSISLACEIVDEIFDWIFVKNQRLVALNGDIKMADVIDFIEEISTKKESKNEG